MNSPFKRIALLISGELPSTFKQTLSYFESLECIVNFIENKILPNVNNNTENIATLTGIVNDLKNYVNTYFDNLDVQEEINKKLDEMALDGTLSNIINREIFGNINKRLSLLDNRKYLFIGDSYADGYNPDGNVIPWETYVKQYLNIADSNFLTIHQGGAGFSDTLSVQFYNLINRLNDDDYVTDVIICGGYNDVSIYATKDKIIQGITNCSNLIKNKFPNAKIYIGFIGNTNVIENKSRLANKITYYIEGCNINNIHYLNNVQYAMHQYYGINSFFSSDGIHPTTLGQLAIAKAITQAILTGSADVVYEYLPANNILTNIGTRLNNNICTLELHSYWAGGITINDLRCTGSNKIILGHIESGYIIGNSNNESLSIINVIFQNVNEYYNIPCRIGIENGELNLYPIALNNNNTNYLTLNATGFQIRPFVIVFNSLAI